jgi:AmmeMemoRadiSam system protein B
MLPAPPTPVRPATQAGRFYPSSPTRLQADVKDYLEQVEPSEEPVPKAIIAPHAGYLYSAAVAATAFVRLASAHARYRRVILLGPSHYEDFEGLAATRAAAFATPLGPVPVDSTAVAEVLNLPQVDVFERAHEPEHSLEVELPFLQTVLDDFSIVPLLVGHADPGEVGEVLEQLWGGDETCVVVSSDLSHYLQHTVACRKDRATAALIEGLRGAELDAGGACGHRAIAGLLEVARARGLRVRTLDLRTSGDTAGSLERVVGYGAFAFTEPGAGKRAGAR